eukprot:231345_1
MNFEQNEMSSFETESQQADTTGTESKKQSNRSGVDIWCNTTHQYLYDPNSSCVDKIIAITTIILQFAIYGGIIYLASSDNNAIVAVTVNLRDSPVSSNGEQRCVSDAALNVNDFWCSSEDARWWVFTIYIIIITKFLMPDFVKSFQSFKFRPIVSIILIFEGIVALGAGQMLMMSLTASGLDVIFSAVTVIFIHDLDEKWYETVNTFSNKTKIIYFIVYSVFIIIMATVSFITTQN